MKLMNIFIAIVILLASIGMAAGNIQHKEFTGIASNDYGVSYTCEVRYDIDESNYITNGYFYIIPICDENAHVFLAGGEGTFGGATFGEVMPYSGNIMVHTPAGGPNQGAYDEGTLQFDGPLSGERFTITERSTPYGGSCTMAFKGCGPFNAVEPSEPLPGVYGGPDDPDNPNYNSDINIDTP